MIRRWILLNTAPMPGNHVRNMRESGFMLIAAAFILLVMIMKAEGAQGNVTELDDGSSRFNLTENTTKYLTLPLNSSILQGNITISHETSYCIQEWANASDGCGLSTGSYSSNEEWNDGNWTSYLVPSGNYGVNYSIPNLPFNESVKLNVSYAGYFGGECSNTYGVSTLYDLPYQYINDSNSSLNIIFNYSSSIVGADIFYYFNIYFENATDGTADLITSTNYKMCKGGSCVGVCLIQGVFVEEQIQWTEYAKNVTLKVNQTVVFNNTGNLTGTNSSINISSALESCNEYEAACPFTFSAGSWGKVEVSDLFVEYNKTNIAILEIISPSQILDTIETESDYEVVINISNMGNYNATNITFETVSALYTPNLNASVTDDCGGIVIESGTTQTCTLTFNDVLVAPEPDEKLKVKATGSDANDTVYSNSIDIDLVVNARAALSGGGGGSVVIDETNRTVIIDWGLIQYERLVFFTPIVFEDKFLVTNRGNKDFTGDLEITGDIGPYIDVAICTEDLKVCDFIGIKLKAGDSRVLVIRGDFEEFDEKYVEGIIKLKSYAADDGVFQLKSQLSRPPAYSVQSWIMTNIGVPQQLAFLLVYVLFPIVLLYTVYEVSL